MDSRQRGSFPIMAGLNTSRGSGVPRIDRKRGALKVAAEEVYRHPMVSFKTSGEAVNASW